MTGINIFWIIIIWAILSLWASRSPSIEMSWNNKEIKSWWVRWLSVFLFPIAFAVTLTIVMVIILIIFLIVCFILSIVFRV